MQELVPNPEDPAVTGQRDLRVVDLRALLRGGEEVLGAILDPFDRPVQSDRQPGQQHLLGIEHHDLGAEAAADERRHHPHLALGHPQHGGQAVADHHRRLGGVPYRQPLGLGVPIGDDAARLDRRRAAAVVAEAATQHQGSGLSSGVVVTLFLVDARCDIAGEVVMDPHRAGRQGALDVDDRRQGLVFDGNVGERIFGNVAALGHHHGHRLADMANFAARQRHLGALVEDRAFDGRRRHQQRARFPIVAEIVGGEGGYHAGPLPDPQQIDRAQPRMGVRAAQEGDVQHPRPRDIIHE
jgi:hypothetical protein